VNLSKRSEAGNNLQIMFEVNNKNNSEPKYKEIGENT
jgi:hypothetical protein